MRISPGAWVRAAVKAWMPPVLIKKMKKERNMRTLKRLVRYYRPYALLLVTDIAAVAGIALLSMIVPYIIKILVDGLAERQSFSLVLTLALGLGAAGILKALLSYYTIYAGHLLAVKMERDMRRDLFYHLQTLSFSFYDNRKTGELMSRMINDIGKVSDTVNHAPEEVFLSVITIAGCFGIMFHLNVPLALISFLPLPFMFIYSHGFGRKMLKGFSDINDATADINARVENSISGIRVVQSFARENHEKTLFNGLIQRYYLYWKGTLHILAWFFSGVDFMRDLSRIIIILAGGYMALRGEISPGTLVAFLFYVSIYLEPIERLTRTNEMIQKMTAGVKNFFALLDEAPEVREAPGAEVLEDAGGDLSFRDVTFGYNDGKKVFAALNLSIPHGKTVALVGPSGAGKTTFCSLIPRFYEPQTGEILLNGKDIRSYTLSSLRGMVGIVQQDQFLFTGTVKENIAYGKEGASMEDVIRAAKKAYAHDFIMELPQGYDTSVGEKGVKLSGGQKQRISIARVFLKDPPILIFDEATSSLDTHSEKIIQTAMYELVRGRTAFIIAHRLSTIRFADEIIVLSDRGIEQRGTHEELYKQEGLYRDLCGSQYHGLILDRDE